MDTDSDGKLSLNEFIQYNIKSSESMSDAEFAKQNSVWLKLATTRTAIDRDSLLRSTFHWCDTNASGTLELSEFIALSKSQDAQSVAMQTAVFGLADTSGDGLLQEDEFVKFNLDTGASLSDFDFAQQLKSWTKLAKARA